MCHPTKSFSVRGEDKATGSMNCLIQPPPKVEIFCYVKIVWVGGWVYTYVFTPINSARSNKISSFEIQNQSHTHLHSPNGVHKALQ